MTKDSTLERSAFRFVLIIGVTNLFADMTYEGARGISGPFLGSLGASAAVVGFVAGAGELLGYGLRVVSGYLADKSRKYWLVVFAGYFIDMLAVPALALAGNWPAGAVLLIAERTGRAIRRPSVEAMISYAGNLSAEVGCGLNEALDQTGATIGPLIAALVLYSHGTYSHSFGVLLIPAILCLATLTVARIAYPRPSQLQDRTAQFLQTKGFPKAYWIYLAAGTLIACGFADFSLIAFHFQKAAVVSQNVIPVFYAVAMAMGAITSLVVGKLFDRIGLPAVLLAFFLPAFSAPLVFLGGAALAFIGMMIWGIGIGAQDSPLKAVLSGVISPKSAARALVSSTQVSVSPGFSGAPRWVCSTADPFQRSLSSPPWFNSPRYRSYFMQIEQNSCRRRPPTILNISPDNVRTAGRMVCRMKSAKSRSKRSHEVFPTDFPAYGHFSSRTQTRFSSTHRTKRTSGRLHDQNSRQPHRDLSEKNSFRQRRITVNSLVRCCGSRRADGYR